MINLNTIQYIKTISESPALIENFAENLLQYVIDTKLDGIDIESDHLKYESNGNYLLRVRADYGGVGWLSPNELVERNVYIRNTDRGR